MSIQEVRTLCYTFSILLLFGPNASLVESTDNLFSPTLLDTLFLLRPSGDLPDFAKVVPSFSLTEAALGQSVLGLTCDILFAFMSDNGRPTRRRSVAESKPTLHPLNLYLLSWCRWSSFQY